MKVRDKNGFRAIGTIIFLFLALALVGWQVALGILCYKIAKKLGEAIEPEPKTNPAHEKEKC